MREILFRGKRVDNDEWICGYCCKIPEEFITEGINIRLKGCEFHSAIQIVLKNEYGCIEAISQPIEVDEKTLGQYTGLCDNNGTKIFEGDIVKATPYGRVELGFVKYEENAFRVVNWFYGELIPITCPEAESLMFSDREVEVIGNVIDNPELLEVGDE